jgi:hypothetical protein
VSNANQNQQEIESVRPALSVVLDDGDFIINSSGPVGKAMGQAVLPLLASARRVTIITDGEMKVMKRTGNGAQPSEKASSTPTLDLVKQRYAEAQANLVKATEAALSTSASAPAAPADLAPDIQDQFAADLEAGRTGEATTGELPSPTPGPSDPVAIPAAKSAAPPRRQPQIFQDAAAPPAPELAEAEMARLLEEAAQAEQDAAKVQEDRRFQAQQAVQSGAPAEEVAQAEPAAATPRRRQRNLAITGSPCGRCGGSGVAYRVAGDGGAVVDESGHAITGVCNVCAGSGQVKRWGRGK